MDDLIEIFGGAPNVKHFIGANGGDDGVDFDEGYRGKFQFGFVVQGLARDDNAYKSDKGAEQDGGNAPDQLAALRDPDALQHDLHRSGLEATYTAKLTNTALHWRDNGGGRYYNSFFGDFGGATMCIEGGYAAERNADVGQHQRPAGEHGVQLRGAGADLGRLGHLVLRSGVGQPAGAEEQHLLVLRERQHDPERDGGPGRDLRLRRGQGLLRPGRLHERGAAEPVPRLQRGTAHPPADPRHRGVRQAGPGQRHRPAAGRGEPAAHDRSPAAERRLLRAGLLPRRLRPERELGGRLVHAVTPRLLPGAAGQGHRQRRNGRGRHELHDITTSQTWTANNEYILKEVDLRHQRRDPDDRAGDGDPRRAGHLDHRPATRARWSSRAAPSSARSGRRPSRSSSPTSTTTTSAATRGPLRTTTSPTPSSCPATGAG